MRKRTGRMAALGAGVLMACGLTLAAAAPAQAATSGVDVLGYCKSQFGAKYLVGTTVRAGDAYSWRCTYAGFPLPYGMDMTRACRSTTGAWWATATLGSSRDAYSWRCFS